MIDLPLHVIEAGLKIFGRGDNMGHQDVYGLFVQCQAVFFVCVAHENHFKL